MQNGLTPNYLCSLVPATVGSASSYPLRNALNLQSIHAKSQLYYNSFLPSVVRDWNDLPYEHSAFAVLPHRPHFTPIFLCFFFCFFLLGGGGKCGAHLCCNTC